MLKDTLRALLLEYSITSLVVVATRFVRGLRRICCRTVKVAK